MQQQDQQSPSFLRDAQNSYNLFCCFVLIASFPVVLISRKIGTWGNRYLSGPFLFGFFWPLLFACFFPPNMPGLIMLLWFWNAQFVLLVLHFLAGMIRRARGYRSHSLFSGLYWFEKEQTPRRKAESWNFLLFFLIGIACCTFSPPLGFLIMSSAMADACVAAIIQQAAQAKLRQMNDARLEQEYLMRLYQEQQ